MTKRLHPDPELEALIQRLNDSAGTAEAASGDYAACGPAAVASGPQIMRWSLPAADDEGRDWLDRLLTHARGAHASDLLVVAGARPAVRVNGQLVPVGEQELSPGGAAMLVAALAPQHYREPLESTGSADFALSQSGFGRLRCNLHRARGHWCASIRLLPEKVPDLSALHLPEEGKFGKWC